MLFLSDIRACGFARHKCSLLLVFNINSILYCRFSINSIALYQVREYATPREKRAGKTPQRGTSEEACLFVRGKGANSHPIYNRKS